MSFPDGKFYGPGPYRDVPCVGMKRQWRGLPAQYLGNLNGYTGSGPGGGLYEQQDGMDSYLVTGPTWLPDITPPSAATAVTTQLVRAEDIPSDMRIYVTRYGLSVNGPISWSNTSPTSIPYISLQDTTGTPLVQTPWSDLTGFASLEFSGQSNYVPVTLGASGLATPWSASPLTTFTYSAGTLTPGTDPMSGLTSETQIVNAPVEIIAGTGIGQTALITAYAAGVATLSVNWGTAAGTVAPDATSIIGIYWQKIKTATSTSASVIFAGTYILNSLDAGFYSKVLIGTGQGQSRPISGVGTGGSMSYGYALSANVDTTTSIISISNGLRGSVDMVTGSHRATAQLGAGLQLVVSPAAGTASVGSTVRAYVEYFVSAN